MPFFVSPRVVFGKGSLKRLGRELEGKGSRAVGIALPYSLEYICSHPPVSGAPDPVERLETAARLIGIAAASQDEAARKFILKVRELIELIGEPTTLGQTGVTEGQMEKEIDTLVRIAASDPNMFTTPCACEEKDLSFFRECGRGGRTHRGKMVEPE